MSDFLRAGLNRNGVCVVVTSAARREALLRRLPSDGRIHCLDAHDVLSKIFKDGHIDPYAFDRYVGDEMRRAVKSGGARPVLAYGDMVGILWAGGSRQAAADLEWYWNDLGSQLPFSLYCGYPIDPRDQACADVRQIAQPPFGRGGSRLRPSHVTRS